MENSIYIGLSKQMVLRNDMSIIANNVANMNTTGFRGQNTLFEEYLSNQRGKTTDKGADDTLSFVYDRGQYQNTKAGSIQQTGNQLDVALNGPGFIAIEGPNGQEAYTRAGDFQIDANGALVTADGYRVKGNITIPSDATEVKIDRTGAISTQNGQIGALEIVEFENVQTVKPLGGNLYTTEDAAQPATNTVVVQGALEGSNVNGVLEMTRMIETLREYQSLNQLMSKENDRLRTAIQKLTSTN